MFSGYKTYITATVAVITTIGTYLSGDATLAESIQIIVPAILAVTIRQGIAKI